MLLLKSCNKSWKGRSKFHVGNHHRKLEKMFHSHHAINHGKVDQNHHGKMLKPSTQIEKFGQNSMLKIIMEKSKNVPLKSCHKS